MAPEAESTKEEEAEASEESKVVQALKAKLETAQAVKERFKTRAVRIQRENDERMDINAATAKALEQETKRARKGKHARKELCGAATTSLNSREKKETSHE